MRHLPLLLIAAACREPADTVEIDGSSTVYPLTEAVAEAHREAGHDAQVVIGISGTGGGFRKLCEGEIHVANASRPIKPSEVERCRENGVAYVELPVALDGVAVVVHPENTWADSLTVDDLRRMWEPAAQGHVMKWSDVRPEWPDHALHLYGAGVDSGTYDYFTAAVVGEQHASRGDYTSSEDDNTLVQGVVGDRYALGFVGFVYYAENDDKLKVVGIDDGDPDNGDGPVRPSADTVRGGTYQPLSRPEFIYVAAAAADRPAVRGFVHFYLDRAPDLAAEVGAVPLPVELTASLRARFDHRLTGTLFGGTGARVGLSVEDLVDNSALEVAAAEP